MNVTTPSLKTAGRKDGLEALTRVPRSRERAYDERVAKGKESSLDAERQHLLSSIDQLAELMQRDDRYGDDLAPATYVDWLLRQRAAIANSPGQEEGANARRRIHAALVCGGDHTPLERAWTRYRRTAGDQALLETIEALTLDEMYACPCCACLTIPDKPPGSWCRCPVCGWEDDGNLMDGGGPNPPLTVARANYENRGTYMPRHLRAPRPEERPHA